MSKARIELEDVGDGQFNMKVMYDRADGPGFDDNSPSHLTANRFEHWLYSQAEPKGPRVSLKTDGTLVQTEDLDGVQRPHKPLSRMGGALAALAAGAALGQVNARLEDGEDVDEPRQPLVLGESNG